MKKIAKMLERTEIWLQMYFGKIFTVVALIFFALLYSKGPEALTTIVGVILSILGAMFIFYFHARGRISSERRKGHGTRRSTNRPGDRHSRRAIGDRRLVTQTADAGPGQETKR
jgi:hypothetical protein